MSRLGWFIAGIGIGTLAVVQLRDNPRAQEAVDEIRIAAKDFSDSISSGYQEREAEIKKSAKPKK
jgi:hypothetical protein